MKEFISAVEDHLYETDETNYDASGAIKERFIEFELAHMEPERDAEGKVIRDEDGKVKATKVVDRAGMRAYQPNEGQLTFMLAALGRGQSKDQRFASIINLMLETLRDDDRDYLEGRLLSSDPKKRIPVKQIEEVFEYLVEQWFREDVSSDNPVV